MRVERIGNWLAAAVLAASMSAGPERVEDRIAKARRRYRNAGAVTVALVVQTVDIQSWSIISTADGDTTTGAITHTCGANPIPSFINVLSQALAALSAWTFVVAQTTWTGTKLATVGSGNAAIQVQFSLMRQR